MEKMSQNDHVYQLKPCKDISRSVGDLTVFNCTLQYKITHIINTVLWGQYAISMEYLFSSALCTFQTTSVLYSLAYNHCMK